MFGLTEVQCVQKPQGQEIEGVGEVFHFDWDIRCE